MFEEYFAQQIEYLPWYEKTDEDKERQLAWQRFLKEAYDAEFENGSFVSTLAKLYGINRLRLGAESFIAAGCLVREASLTIGKHCSLNSNCYLQGNIKIGDFVRVAPNVNIIAMNHNFDSVNLPISMQGLSHKGIVIEDDVWIGAGVTVLDGVRIGAHSVIGAGAVVTKDIAPYSVAAGNPARIIRSRLSENRGQRTSGSAISAFCDKVRSQLQDLLQYYTAVCEGQNIILNTPDSEPTVRAWCDAVELLGMLGMLEDWPEKDGLLKSVSRFQKPAVDYDVLTVGYALEVLGAAPQMPFSQADEICVDISGWLESLPWTEDAWCAGSEVDHLCTAIYFNKKYFNAPCFEKPLIEWLISHQNPETGLWGQSENGDFRLTVNGFYRLSRGSFAQFGVMLPRPETIVDTVLRHSKNPNYFRPNRGNACDVLDVIHPLWLCANQTSYRREEGAEWADAQITRILERWHDGCGFSFELEKEYLPTLQGTEMWLSILYYLCVYTGKVHALNYAPLGVHRA